MSDADQVREFEDRRWSAGAQAPVWRHSTAAEMVRREPVVDVGGGGGLLLRMLRERGLRELMLLDISPVAVQRARAEGFAAEVADVTRPLPFGDDAFGTVCALDVLEHLRDPAPALREMARIALEVVIAVPNFQYAKGRAEMLLGRVPFQNRARRGHAFWMNESVLERLIDDAGLRVEERRYEPSARLGRLGPGLARSRPNLFAASFAARCRKAQA